MSKADFTAQQAAIAPAVTELDKPEIKVGQVWRRRNGTTATVVSHNPDDWSYPWKMSDGEIVTNNGMDWESGEDSDVDLVELIRGADGYTIFRGGACPVSLTSKVEARLRSGESIVQVADHLSWSHGPDDRDIVAYKVVEAAKDPSALIGSPDGADALAYAIDLGAPEGDRHVVAVEIPPGYDKLFAVLMQAFEQASGGKGKERHAKEGVPFEDQPMSTINRQLGSIDGFIYQAHKKSLESKRLPDGRGQAELLGAVNYLCGAVIALDTWAKKDSEAD